MKNGFTWQASKPTCAAARSAGRRPRSSTASRSATSRPTLPARRSLRRRLAGGRRLANQPRLRRRRLQGEPRRSPFQRDRGEQHVRGGCIDAGPAPAAKLEQRLNGAADDEQPNSDGRAHAHHPEAARTISARRGSPTSPSCRHARRAALAVAICARDPARIGFLAMVPFGIKREHGPGREAEAVAAPATVSGETTPLMITEKPGRSASIVDPRPASQETCHRSCSRSRAR
jgi:hypothetical protein